MENTELHAGLRDGTLSGEALQALPLEQLTARNAAGNTLLHTAAKYGRLTDLPASAAAKVYTPPLTLYCPAAGAPPTSVMVVSV